MVMRNVSSDGANFSGLGGLEEGESVTYFVGNLGPVDAIVRWIKADSFGVQNVGTMGGSPATSPEFPYRSVRIPFVAEARLYSGGLAASATLYNFSQGGACVASSVGLSNGELVTLELADFAIEAAEIKWLSGRQAGVKFARSLDRQTMQLVLDRLQHRTAPDKVSPGSCGIRAA